MPPTRKAKSAVSSRRGDASKARGYVRSTRRVRAAPAARPMIKARSTGRELASKLGSRAGSAVGGALSDALSMGFDKVKGLISSAMGSGDYVIGSTPSSNVLVSSTQIPKFDSRRVATIISHREYLGDLYSSSVSQGFVSQSYRLQPGDASTFPWLAQIAQNYEQWRPLGIMFEYKSMSSDFNATGQTLGSVVISTDYDSTDAIFQTKQQMENTEFAVSCKTSQSMLHGIECGRTQSGQTELYVRPGGLGTSGSSADLRNTDFGITTIGVTGVTGTSINLGEIWVSYSIAFYKPVQDARLSNALCTRIRLPLTNTAAAPYGLTGSTIVFDNIGVTNAPTFTTSSLRIPRTSMPAGTIFEICWSVIGGATASVLMSAYNSCTTSLTRYNGYFNGTAPQSFNPSAASTVAQAESRFMFKVEHNGIDHIIYWTIPGTTWPTSITGLELTITQMNGLAFPITSV